MIKKLDVRKTLTVIYKAIKGHIGSNGAEAHLPADEFVNGFMTSDHVKRLDEANGKRTWVTGLDVFDLPSGHYEGNQLENTPDLNAIYEVDVYNGSGGRRQIFLLESGSGKIFVRNWHTGGIAGNTPNGWSSVNRELTLWSGSEGTVGERLTFIQNPRVYSKIRIEMNLNGAGFSEVTIDNLTNNAIYAIQGFNLSDNLSSTIMETFEITFFMPSGENYFEIRTNRKINFSNGEATIKTADLATITGVYGIK